VSSLYYTRGKLRVFPAFSAFAIYTRTLDEDDMTYKGYLKYEKLDDDDSLYERGSLSDSEELSVCGSARWSSQNGNDWSFLFKKCVIWTYFISLIALNIWIVFYLKSSHFVVDINKTEGMYLQYQPHPPS